MDDLQIISDGDGLAVIGPLGTVETFLAAHELESREFDVQRLATRVAAHTGNMADGAARFGEESGRWVKLTAKSAKDLKDIGLMTQKSTGQQLSVLQTSSGEIKGFLQIARVGSGLLSPAGLAMAGAMMAQYAQQQQMEEIQEYLATIDRKVDDILRNQKNAQLAGMIGVAMMIDDALAVRNATGRVSDVTWSKLQASPKTVADTMAYALLQLRDLGARQELGKGVTDAAKATETIATEAQEWLSVIAECFRLSAAIDILELDRVMDAAPEEVERHRDGLMAAREVRADRVRAALQGLMTPIDKAAERANKEVLLNPFDSPRMVKNRNRVAADVAKFKGTVGLDDTMDRAAARQWLGALADTRDQAVAAGKDAFSDAEKLVDGFFNRAFRRRGSESQRTTPGDAEPRWDE